MSPLVQLRVQGSDGDSTMTTASFKVPSGLFLKYVHELLIGIPLYQNIFRSLVCHKGREVASRLEPDRQ